MWSIQPLNEALMLSMDFTPDELDLNRSRRRLSQRQRARLKRMGGFALIWRGLCLGLLLVGGGTSAPYLFISGNTLFGGFTAVLVIVLMPLMMIEMSFFQMDEATRQRHGKAAVVSNAVLGILFASAFTMFVYDVLNRSESKVGFVQNLLVAGIGAVLVGPLIYLFQYLFFPEVRVVEGKAKIEPEGFGSEQSAWKNELGVIANLTMLAAVLTRNLMQGRGLGSRPEDFKFITGYSVIIGNRKFYTSKAIAKSFVQGATYRVYFTSGNPLPILLSGEAL